MKKEHIELKFTSCEEDRIVNAIHLLFNIDNVETEVTTEESLLVDILQQYLWKKGILNEEGEITNCDFPEKILEAIESYS